MPEPASDPARFCGNLGAQTAVAITMELQATSVAAAKSQSVTASTRRLVIRVEMISKGAPRAPVRRRLNRGALLLILGAVAVLLGWVGISVFRTEPTSVSATERGPNSESQSPAPVPAPSKAT